MVNISLPELQSSIYNASYFHRQDVCRLCWQYGATTDLLQDNKDVPQDLGVLTEPKMPCLEGSSNVKTENSDVTEDLAVKISYSLHLDIKYGFDKNFPRKICDQCIQTVNEFYKYKTFCEQSEKRLKDIFSKIEDVKIENQFDIKTESEQITDYDSCCSADEPLLNLKNKIESDKSPRKKKSNSNLEHSEKDEENVASVKNGKICQKIRTLKPRSVTYCNICHIEYGDKFAEHNRSAHGVEEGGFKCFGCEKRFGTRKSRLAHELKFCKGLKEGYRCASCSTHLPSRRAYESHARDHRAGRTPAETSGGVFQCAPCDKSFKTRSNLLQHLTLHQDKKNFVCEMCGRVFHRQDYLRKHILTHTGQKQYVCPHCGFRATQKSSLTVHIRKHTGERPFQCDICQQKCVSSSNLLAHRRRHDGLKKFECSLCGKKFGYKLSLEEHMASTHERLKTHACKLCGATYTRQRGLRRHTRVKHGAQYDENATDFLKINDDEVLKNINTEECIKNSDMECAGMETFLKNSNKERSGMETFLKNSNVENIGMETFLKNSNTERSGMETFLKNSNAERSGMETFLKNSNMERSGMETFLKNLGTERSDDYLKDLNAGQSEFLKMEARPRCFLKRQDGFMKDSDMGHRSEDNLDVRSNDDYLKSVGQSDNAYVVI